MFLCLFILSQQKGFIKMCMCLMLGRLESQGHFAAMKIFAMKGEREVVKKRKTFMNIQHCS